MYLELPPKVSRILTVLQSHGYEAFAVGGCVRDAVLGREPDDWDITTSARPQEVKALFLHTVDTGLAHGTVTVLLGRDGYEVTTYRIDGEYEDCRHPSGVVFSSNLEEDLRRRDFTINAMAYNREQGLVDIFGGMEDLQRKQIRCVGEARERFLEDALRILRAVRFSAQLGFSVETATKEALRELAGNLKFVSAERIQTELVKLLLSPHPDFIMMLFELNIDRVILPEIRAQEEAWECLEEIAHSLCLVPAGRFLRLALFLRPLGERQAYQVLRRLKFDNHTTGIVRRLIRWYGCELKAEPAAVRRAAAKIGGGLFPMVLKLQDTYRDVSRVQEIWNEIVREQHCISLKTLQISGNDLIGLGMKPGQAVGDMLDALFQDVLENPEHNTKEYLMKCADEMLRKPMQ